MQVHTVQPHGWLQYVFPIAIFIVVFGLRARRMTQLRPLKVERLWIVPALYLAIVGAVFYAKPPTLAGWGLALVGLLIGGAIGWQRGKTMQIHVDPETHALNQKGSLLAMLFIIAIVAVKSIPREEFGALHLNVDLVTDAFATLSLGMFSAQRVEMYLRAKRLLGEARAARA